MSKIRPFIIEVKTDNAGTSSGNQFTIPTGGGGYSYTIRTSNGVTTGNTGNVTITWPISGTYEIEIYGAFPRIHFDNGGDRLKILKIKQWGTISWTNMINAFLGCSNLDVTATDAPDLSTVTIISGMFSDCTSLINSNNSIGNWNISNILEISGIFSGCASFNVPLNSWNTSSVTNMNNAFALATSFNQNIGNWDVSNVITFQSIFFAATQFNNGGNDSIKNWQIKTTGAVNMDQVFQAAYNFNQPIGSWNTSAVTSMGSMFNNASAFNQDISGWNTSSVTNMSSMFNSATSFNRPINTSGSSWNVSSVTTMSSMFNVASAFNQDIGNWDVSNVTDFQNMFRASVFNNGGNSSIGGWPIKTTGNVFMPGMFQINSAFNQPIGAWNTSAVTNMTGMFNGATAFNQNIGAWNVSNVASFLSIFSGASSFNNGGNSSIGGWTIKTSGSVSMQQMFEAATSFNQPIGTWNTSAVTNMLSMFAQAGSFNQNIGSWNVSSVSDFTSMFLAASSFNNGGSSSINGWIIKTSGSVTMLGMFSSSAFNQPINLWNTSEVTSTFQMFQNSPFNRDISSWNVSKVTDMRFMFSSTSAFNQNLSIWSLRSTGVLLNNIFAGSVMSTANYTDTIVGWANYVQSNSNTPASVSMANQGGRTFQDSGSGGAGFGNAAAARSYLTTAIPTGGGWDISGDTIIP